MSVRIPHGSVGTADWLVDAIDGLEQTPVYVDRDVAGGQAWEQALVQIVPDDGSLAVAVLPENARVGQQYDTYLLDEIFSASGYDTVVIVIGDDLQAQSRVVENSLQIANETERSFAGDTEGALTETVHKLVDAAPSGGGGAAAPAGADAFGWVLPIVVGAVVAGGAVTAAVVSLRRRRKRSSGALPAVIVERVAALRGLRAEYARLAASGHRVAAETVTEIDALTSNIDQLFQRLDARAAGDQRALAEVEYADKLARLLAALEKDYLLDMLVHPELWEDTTERVREVREALGAVSAQLVDNIRQVNARRALHFQVSLDSLVGREELRGWEREFKRSSES